MVMVHTIMSTLSSSSWVVKGWGKTFSGAKPCGFTGLVAPGVAKVGFVFLRFWALLIHWFIALFKYRFIGSLVRCFVDSLCGSWIHVYYLHMDSLSHWFIDSLVTSFLGSFSQLYVDFFFPDSFSGISTASHLLIRWCISQLQHLRSCCISKFKAFL
jgi:hypothetical protein